MLVDYDQAMRSEQAATKIDNDRLIIRRRKKDISRHGRRKASSLRLISTYIQTCQEDDCQPCSKRVVGLTGTKRVRFLGVATLSIYERCPHSRTFSGYHFLVKVLEKGILESIADKVEMHRRL